MQTKRSTLVGERGGKIGEAGARPQGLEAVELPRLRGPRTLAGACLRLPEGVKRRSAPHRGADWSQTPRQSGRWLQRTPQFAVDLVGGFERSIRSRSGSWDPEALIEKRDSTQSGLGARWGEPEGRMQRAVGRGERGLNAASETPEPRRAAACSRRLCGAILAIAGAADDDACGNRRAMAPRPFVQPISARRS